MPSFFKGRVITHPHLTTPNKRNCAMVNRKVEKYLAEKRWSNLSDLEVSITQKQGKFRDYYFKQVKARGRFAPSSQFTADGSADRKRV